MATSAGEAYALVSKPGDLLHALRRRRGRGIDDHAPRVADHQEVTVTGRSKVRPVTSNSSCRGAMSAAAHGNIAS
jgi:hypothetical protein